RRDRARSEHGALPRPARPRPGGLSDHEAGLDRDQHPGRVRRRRRPGPRVPPGRHRGRLRLYGRARRGALPRRHRGSPDGGRGRASPLGHMAEWIDLIDPTADELRAELPLEIQESALRRLLKRADEDQPRPTLQSHGDYIFGIFLVALAMPDEDRVVYQEIDVVLTHEVLLTVSKTPKGEQPYDPQPVRESCQPDDETGMMFYRLVDDIAEHYLTLVDALDDEISELEDQVEGTPAELTRSRLSELRHNLLRIARTLAPTRDAVHRVVDNAVELRGRREIFPHDVEIAFESAYDKLLRAVDGLALSRDLLAGAR